MSNPRRAENNSTKPNHDTEVYVKCDNTMLLWLDLGTHMRTRKYFRIGKRGKYRGVFMFCFFVVVFFPNKNAAG